MPGPLVSIESLLDRAGHYLVRWDASVALPRLEIRYNPRMRTRAGVAWLEEQRIDLNPRLLARHRDRIEETLVHELAHLVVFAVHGPAAEPHGPEWRGLMTAAGAPRRRFHGMDVGGLRTERRRFYYLHTCLGCREWWIARRLRRDRVCRTCGPGEVHVRRAEATDAGLNRLKALAARMR